MITKFTKNLSVSIKKDIVSLREEPSNNDEGRRESGMRVVANSLGNNHLRKDSNIMGL